ncbi:MAG: Rieske (2Fe-2S) protein [Polyangiaceae bacterium]|nr:Rieske (2Fe-2S) protein [Polyangiaceae bacterium]
MSSVLRLPPFPKGWYSIGFSDELPPGSVTTHKLAGRELVVFRTESGELSAVDPICPHLGAHLGHGGSVTGETLRCPFHGFLFGTDGACVATSYGTKPPKVRARTWSILENHDTVFVWFDPKGEPPSFDIPPLDMRSYVPLTRAKYRFRGHPQDTTENSVDIGHLTVVHGYERPKMLGDLREEGAALHATYEFYRPIGLFGKGFGGVRAEFDAHVHGLGYSFVEARTPALGLEFRYFVFATPVDEMDLELRIAGAVRKLETCDLKGPLKPLGFSRHAARAVEPLVQERSFRVFQSDVEQDFKIWKYKEFVPRPALAIGDGPVMKYRRWAEQFYDELVTGKGSGVAEAAAGS